MKGSGACRAPRGVFKRVVEVVRRRRGSLASSQQPELLEVADVREVPHERRLQRRELPRELFIRERFEQCLGSPARMLEPERELGA